MIKILSLIACLNFMPGQFKSNETKEDNKPNIQVALLLDVSNSMDGLISQAKAQLWKMVNMLAKAEKNGQSPNIEISLYEYGKSSLSQESGYVNQIVPLTTDLDLISEKLFDLKTNGGEEYCGWAIQSATNELIWRKGKNDLKLIIVAGNEAFNQGRVAYTKVCKKAIAQGIQVNTIFCGDCEEGVRTFWKDGADLTDGKYMCINQDEEVVHVPTPYDNNILDLNKKLNATYLSYGKEGAKKKKRQSFQDDNAAGLGAANSVSRVMSKSGGNYNNANWDLVDAYEENEEIVTELNKKTLPAEYQNLTNKELEAKIKTLQKTRKAIQEEIRELGKKAEAFRTKKMKEIGEKSTLDNVMLKAIKSQAKDKGYKFN